MPVERTPSEAVATVLTVVNKYLALKVCVGCAITIAANELQVNRERVEDIFVDRAISDAQMAFDDLD